MQFPAQIVCRLTIGTWEMMIIFKFCYFFWAVLVTRWSWLLNIMRNNEHCKRGGSPNTHLISLVFLKTGLPSFSSPISNRSEYSSLLLWSTWKSAHLSAFTRFFAYICKTTSGKEVYNHKKQNKHCITTGLFQFISMFAPDEMTPHYICWNTKPSG